MMSVKGVKAAINPEQALEKTCAVILALKRGERRLDGSKSVPSGLERVARDAPTLQWILRAL